jgi:Family of unknown function (DUF6286)
MRLLNRPLAFILALALAIASVILIVEVIAVAVNHPPVIVHWHLWYRWANNTRWKQGVIRFWSIVLIIIGALLLAMQLKPRRVQRLALRSDDDTATDAAMTRRGLAGALRAAATDVDGIRRATVTVGRRRAQITANAAAKDKAGAHALREPIRESVDARLDNLQLTHPPRVRIRVVPRTK